MNEKKKSSKILKNNSLNELVGKYKNSSVVQELTTSYHNQDKIVDMAISKLVLPDLLNEQFFQIKENDDAFESIKNTDYIIPLIVRKQDDKYEIIDGSRRFLIAKKLKKEHIKVIINNELTDEFLVYFILTNQLKDNNSLLKAYTYKTLIDTYNLTQTRIAELTNLSLSQIKNCLRLLSLPTEVKKMIVNNSLSYGQARALIGLERKSMITLAKKVVKDDISVHDLENLVKRIKSKDDNPTTTQLDNMYNSVTKLYSNKLTMYFKNKEDLNKVLEKLLG